MFTPRLITLSAAALLAFGCSPRLAPRAVSLIPEPAKIEIDSSAVFTLRPGAKIGYKNDSLRTVAEYLQATIEKQTGLRLTVAPTAKDSAGTAIMLAAHLGKIREEAYRLVVSENIIRINGSTARGLIMSGSTLQQLIGTDSGRGASIYCMYIDDEPRFDYRGLHLDVGRHFYTADQVKEILDLMSRYKYNKFHWHLTDDQGWRIEIKSYPLLTDKGSWRSLNKHDRQCADFEKSQDDPAFILPADRLRINGTDTLYGGFYTHDEIREVVQYATARGIDIVPELDMPGHLMAAITGYPQLSCKGKAQWGESFSDPLCVGSDTALLMVKNIYREVAELFPYEYMHLGADEVEKTNWKACPKCQSRMRAAGLQTEEELQAWFVHQMESAFNVYGKKLMGWDEIVEGGLSPTATIMWWRNWAPNAVAEATASGNKVVMSPSFSLYLDYWEDAGKLRDTYNYEPIPEGFTPQQAKHIMGLQGNLWTETVPSFARVQYMYFPRALAIAETGWSRKEHKNWERFQEKLITETEFLDAKGIYYRIPSLTGFAETNVFADTATVAVNCLLPRVEIRYTTDGSNPTAESTLYAGPVVVDKTTNFVFRAFRPDGTAGEMFKTAYRKEGFAPALTAAPTNKGIAVDRYSYKGRSCAEIATLGRKVETLVLDSLNFDITGQTGYGHLGMIATGYIEIPTDDIYEFSLTSDDGSMLYVDNTELINFDGSHNAKTKTAQRGLAKGLHKVTVQYFENNNGGSLKLMLGGEVIKNYKH